MHSARARQEHVITCSRMCVEYTSMSSQFCKLSLISSCVAMRVHVVRGKNVSGFHSEMNGSLFSDLGLLFRAVSRGALAQVETWHGARESCRWQALLLYWKWQGDSMKKKQEPDLAWHGFTTSCLSALFVALIPDGKKVVNDTQPIRALTLRHR